MALDTITIHFIIEELTSKIIGGKIEKIYQPERDEIVLNIKTYTDNFKLLISANASHPRLHLTNVSKENPQKAPMFCMLLRKHLQGGKIINIQQIDCERIVRIDVDSYDELGDRTTKHLYCEIMGRHSNIILTKTDHTIIDAIKHIDFIVSSVRQILPGMAYTLPPKQNKIPILSDDYKNAKFDFSNEGQTPEKCIMNVLTGISPLLVREVVFRATNENNFDCSQLSDSTKQKLSQEIMSVMAYEKRPCMITDMKTGNMIEFSPFDILQYGDSAKKIMYENMSALLDDFYKTRDSIERMKQKSTDLVQLLKNSIERVSKKLTILKKTVEDAKKKDEYKIKADLLTANIYRITQGLVSITVENFYDAELSQIDITLNPTLTPSQNIQRYYKLYQKAKTAEIEAAKQFKSATEELIYLESTLVLTQNAQTESDLGAIRQELSELGYLTRRSVSKNNKNPNTAKPHHYISSDGFDIYVGKNNTQNDYLTLKFSNSQDMWFHTKKIHGSHTVIKLGINKDIPKNTIKEAAALAAYYSKARESSNVPVDYTQINNVRKPNGAKPGMVIYDYYNTIYVNPDIENLKKLN